MRSPFFYLSHSLTIQAIVILSLRTRRILVLTEKRGKGEMFSSLRGLVGVAGDIVCVERRVVVVPLQEG
jgi:hypothetical protein